MQANITFFLAPNNVSPTFIAYFAFIYRSLINWRCLRKRVPARLLFPLHGGASRQSLQRDEVGAINNREISLIIQRVKRGDIFKED